MANFAVVNGNIVDNVIVAESLEIAQEITGKVCIEYTDENPAAIGWAYNEKTQKFGAVEATTEAVLEAPTPEEI
jgi:hypothetical protein